MDGFVGGIEGRKVENQDGGSHPAAAVPGRRPSGNKMSLSQFSYSGSPLSNTRTTKTKYNYKPSAAYTIFINTCSCAYRRSRSLSGIGSLTSPRLCRHE